MLNTTRLAAITMLAAGAIAATPVMAQQTAYAIGNGGTTLLRFDISNPSNVTVVGQFAGGAAFLDAIDFRVSTGEVYGYLDSSDSFFTVDLNTAQLTLHSTGASAAPTNTFQLGMDFNPVVDRLRIITDSTQNIVYNPSTRLSSFGTAVSYGVGDINELANPGIIDNAYTQNRVGAMTTQQYAIDYNTNSLVRVANDAGTLTTVGLLGVDADIYSGFDIFTNSQGVDVGYALLTPLNGTAGFYTIDLSTGAATLASSFGFTNQVYSLAVVPAPGAAAMLGVLMLGGMRRTRRVAR